MNKANSLFIFIWLLLSVTHSHSQQAQFYLMVDDDSHNFGTIYTLTQDKPGYIWFGSDLKGLVRYNGKEFTEFKNDPENPNAFKGKVVVNINVDSSGMIWISTFGQGLERFDPATNNFTHHRHNQSNEAITISNDIRENQEKINHHGKRADAIVKGMLQHSRSSTGIKELTDLNALTDEYLRLAYHGLRAKDKSFNAIMKSEYDPAISMVNIIPQDIGRVVLNLFTNAFYAVAEKGRQSSGEYQPTVSVSTKKMNGKVQIVVKDNGFGISPKVLDKIFQPLFSTKPTGQGTGLGLSLSYDIIKAHGGELRVETKEGEYAAFVISLPV